MKKHANIIIIGILLLLAAISIVYLFLAKGQRQQLRNISLPCKKKL